MKYLAIFFALAAIAIIGWASVAQISNFWFSMSIGAFIGLFYLSQVLNDYAKKQENKDWLENAFDPDGGK